MLCVFLHIQELLSFIQRYPMLTPVGHYVGTYIYKPAAKCGEICNLERGLSRPQACDQQDGLILHQEIRNNGALQDILNDFCLRYIGANGMY